jgi:hypothetical protein
LASMGFTGGMTGRSMPVSQSARVAGDHGRRPHLAVANHVLLLEDGEPGARTTGR